MRLTLHPVAESLGHNKNVGVSTDPRTTVALRPACVGRCFAAPSAKRKILLWLATVC